MILKFLTISGTLFIISLSGLFAEETNAEKKYDIFYDGMEVIIPDGEPDHLKVDLNVEKIGPTQFNVNGYVEHEFEFTESHDLQFTVYKSDKKDGEYHTKIRYPLSGKKGTCAFLKDEYKRYFYESLKDCSNAPHYDTCPLPPAKYTLTNYKFDASAFKKFFSPGYFIVTAIISKGDGIDFLFQLKLDFHIEEIAE